MVSGLKILFRGLKSVDIFECEAASKSGQDWGEAGRRPAWKIWRGAHFHGPVSPTLCLHGPENKDLLIYRAFSACFPHQSRALLPYSLLMWPGQHCQAGSVSSQEAFVLFKKRPFWDIIHILIQCTHLKCTIQKKWWWQFTVFNPCIRRVV